MLTMLNADAPVFCSVTVCAALVVRTFCEAKVKLSGLMVATGPPAVAVPVRVTVCGLPGTLSAKLMDAVRAPETVGANTTLTVRFAPTATEAPQVLVCVKSPAFVPVMVMLEIVTALFPVLNSVTPLGGLLVLMDWLANVRFEVLKLMEAAVPVPVSEAVCGLPAALSATETLAARVPEAVGVNVTLMLQLAAAASEAPQVFICVKSPGLVPLIVMLVMVSAAVPVLLSVTTPGALLVPTP
ncbi:MAG TPA: hypothetical protein VKJ01_16035 [Candidatus Solibacter sp.]|nr:hypothetical protein [Candidatus Solibacter sp.]